MNGLAELGEAVRCSPDLRKLCLDLIRGLVLAELSAAPLASTLLPRNAAPASPEAADPEVARSADPTLRSNIDPFPDIDASIIAILQTAGHPLAPKDIVAAGHAQNITLLRDEVARVLTLYVRRGWAAQVGSTYRLVRIPDPGERRKAVVDRPNGNTPTPPLATFTPQSSLNRGGTQEVTLTILRWAGSPLSITEITAMAHQAGLDVMSSSVRKGIARLLARGLVVRTGRRYAYVGPAAPPSDGGTALDESARQRRRKSDD